MQLLKYILHPKIDWSRLSSNPNADALRLIETNYDKINWHSLCENPNTNANLFS